MKNLKNIEEMRGNLRKEQEEFEQICMPVSDYDHGTRVCLWADQDPDSSRAPRKGGKRRERQETAQRSQRRVVIHRTTSPIFANRFAC